MERAELSGARFKRCRLVGVVTYIHTRMYRYTRNLRCACRTERQRGLRK